MRRVFAKISACLLATALTALAQEPQEAAAANEPASSAAASPTASQPSTASSQAPKPGTTDASAALDYLFNRKPQDGSVGQQAVDANRRTRDKAVASDAVGVNRVEDLQTRARFERYLGTAAVPQETLDANFAEIKKVTELLRDGQIFEAWKKLYEMADYQIIDAGISRELANRVESIWNMGRASRGIDKRNQQIQKDVRAANRNADIMSESLRAKEVEYQRDLNRMQRQAQHNGSSGSAVNASSGGAEPVEGPNPSAGGAGNPSMAGLEGKLQVTEEYLRSLELKARIKLNELKQEKLLEEAKAGFSEYISTLFNSGRLNHEVLAADFYRKIFQESEYPASMPQQVNASLEINRDVASAVDVFRYKVDRGQLSGASDSLQQAFVTSELNPAVLGQERPLKEKVADFNARLDQMQNLIEARDFGSLETLLKEVKATATDFDTTKPIAIVNAVKLESKMRLGKAKLAAQQGDLKLAMEEFQAAAQAWPGNPDLEDKALTFFETQDVKSQTPQEFDRMIAEENFRGIFDKQLAFAPAIKGDARREESLKKSSRSHQGSGNGLREGQCHDAQWRLRGRMGSHRTRISQTPRR